jgi:ubiquinone/menaquinone biosynthesis C-methylase UbiE
MLDKMYRRRFNDTTMRSQLWDILVKHYFQQFIGKDDSVLDMPCGYGEFINTVKCGKKYALDINPDSKKYLKKGIKFLNESSTKLSLKDNTLDIIFISNFFEHLTHSAITDTTRECHRVLKHGGRVMVLQPNIRFAKKNYWMFFDHITPIDDRALEEVFTLNGFKLTKRVLRFVPFTTQSKYPARPAMIRWYLRMPLVWKILGQQTFLIFEKT